MRTHAWAFVLLLLAAAATGASLAGCGNACVDLAEKICACEPTEARQAECRATVDSQSLADGADSAQLQRCTQLNETCSCAALACGDIAACGLARDSGFTPSQASCR